MSEPSPAEPTAEELAAELQKASVADLLVHTCSLLASLAYGKLAPGVRDLEQARLAIDALGALVEVVPEAERPSLRQAVSNLRLAYAGAAVGGDPDGPSDRL